jgi:UDP-glucose 4-epimerase
MQLYGGGSQVSDSVYVTDVAHVFVQALEKAAQGIIPDHPVDVGNAIPTTVLAVAQEVQRNVPGADIAAVPMRPGEPSGGPVDTEEALDALVRAVLGANPSVRPTDARRVLRQLGTVVSADVTTLASIGLSTQEFVPLSAGIARTVEWFREMEGVTWQSPN